MMQPVPKPLAALSSGLLARKGQARPAMRRHATLAEAGEELGWNDMGDPDAVPTAPASEPPLVLAQCDELDEAPIAAEEPAASGRRAAFTLRLDADRHLRLRLAAASRRTSAQRLVTQALDEFLKITPEGKALAERPPKAPADRLGDGT